MGPDCIKKDVYNVMTQSRELTNYCQESVKSIKSKTISDALNNFHLQTSVDFITKSLTDKYRLCFEPYEIDFSNPPESENKPIYKRVIDYIEDYLIEPDL